MKKIVLLLTALPILSLTSLAQQEDDQIHTSDVKKGIIPVGLPAIAYDQDKGFLYGVILNFFHYGDGSRYPRYDHSFYLEWSRTTKGSGKNIFNYDLAAG